MDHGPGDLKTSGSLLSGSLEYRVDFGCESWYALHISSAELHYWGMAQPPSYPKETETVTVSVMLKNGIVVMFSCLFGGKAEFIFI